MQNPRAERESYHSYCFAFQGCKGLKEFSTHGVGSHKILSCKLKQQLPSDTRELHNLKCQHKCILLRCTCLSKIFFVKCNNRLTFHSCPYNIQGDPTQVTGLPELLVLSYVDRFRNPFSHLTTTLGDLIEHIKHFGTCTITWITNLISFPLIYRFSFHLLSFPRHEILNNLNYRTN